MAKIELSAESFKHYEDKMKVTMEVLEEDFNQIRAGRANPRVLDKIYIQYYGMETPLNQVANIQVPEARMITITPWEPTVLKDIEKAIQVSDLGINPNNDGKCIRLLFPQLTEERRRELTKQVSQLGEDAKIAIRNVRREAIELFRGYLKKNEIAEDDLYYGEQEMQKITDKYTEKIDKAVKVKEKELLEI